MRYKTNHRPRLAAGFTLMELVGVVAIMALLIVLILPAIGKAMRFGRTAKGLSNLRTLAAGNVSYLLERGNFPPAWINPNPDTKKFENWRNAITPYLGAANYDTLEKNGLFTCPNVEWEWAESTKARNPVSYSANEKVMPGGSQGEEVAGARLSTIPRPGEVVLIMDASTRNGGNADGNFHKLNVSDDPHDAKEPILVDDYANSPRAMPRFRQGNASPSMPGSINAAFCDGSARTLEYGRLLNKHISIAY